MFEQHSQNPIDRVFAPPCFFVFTSLLVAGLACSTPPRSLESPNARVVQVDDVRIHLGERETLIEDDALGFSFFPDEAVSVIQTDPTLKLLVAAVTIDLNFSHWPPADVVSGSWLIEGSDMRHLDRAVEVLRPGAAGSFDNGYAGFSGSYVDPDDPAGRIYGFYHAEDQEGMAAIAGGALLPPGFHASVALATSDDGGYTWEKLGPVLTSAKVKGWTHHPGQGATGVGVPGFVLDPRGEYLYALYSDFSAAEGRGVQTCIARSRVRDGPPLPGTWEKYYQGAFSEPGIAGRESAVVSAFHLDEASASQSHVVYSDSLERYVMVTTFNFWKEWYRNKGPLRQPVHRSMPGFNSGIYVLFSEDLIHWSEPQRLIRAGVAPQLGKPISWQPTILWDPSSSHEGWLVYGWSPEFGHPLQGAVPTHMVGRRIRFESSSLLAAEPQVDP